MTKSHEEINFVRLLNKCEKLGASFDVLDWRYGVYVETLTRLFKVVSTHAQKPSEQLLKEYGQRLEFLVELVAIGREPDANKKLLLVDSIVTDSSSTPSQQDAREKLKSIVRNELLKPAKSATEDNHELIRRSVASSGSVKPVDAVDSSTDNRQLLGLKANKSTLNSNKSLTDADLEMVIQQHRQTQQQLADEMLDMARTLKNNVTIAQSYVQSDNRTLTKSIVTADQNKQNLQVEADRLEREAKKWCSCWIFAVCLLVVFVFIWMVLVMRLFPKRNV